MISANQVHLVNYRVPILTSWRWGSYYQARERLTQKPTCHSVCKQGKMGSGRIWALPNRRKSLISIFISLLALWHFVGLWRRRLSPTISLIAFQTGSEPKN